MKEIELMKERHSVRSYLEKPVGPEERSRLSDVIAECNRLGGLNIQPVFDEPEAFGSFMAHYGKFSGVKNYVALIGRKGEDEKIGYYGEKIVLAAQEIGLNTCRVALTYKKIRTAFTVGKDEKLYCVIALGYGATSGVPHKSKSPDAVSDAIAPPDWFRRGIEAVLLAPTAMNQQKFVFSLDGNRVSAKAGGGFYTKIDLGIAKYHFETGAGIENFVWAE